jgi:N-acetylglucosamine-6-phosphate deacetylase
MSDEETGFSGIVTGSTSGMNVFGAKCAREANVLGHHWEQPFQRCRDCGTMLPPAEIERARQDAELRDAALETAAVAVGPERPEVAAIIRKLKRQP